MQHYAKQFLLSLERAQRWHLTPLPALPESTYSSFTPQGSQGNLWVSTTGSLMKTRGGASNEQHSGLGRPNSYLCSSAESGQWPSLTEEFGRVLFCLIWFPKCRVLQDLEPWLPMPRKKSWAITPHPHCGCSSWPLPTKKLVWGTSGSYVKRALPVSPRQDSEIQPHHCRVWPLVPPDRKSWREHPEAV